MTARIAFLKDHARSRTMMSLVEIPQRPNSPKKAKEAEDIEGNRFVLGKQEEEEELIILRRKISLLNAQHAVQARESMEALEEKDREMLNMRSEINNLEQTVSRERSLRKKAEERVEALESEVQKLRRLASAYKTKLMKSTGVEMNRGGNNSDEIITPRLELPPDHALSHSLSSPLVSSLSTGSVPASQRHLLSTTLSSHSANNLSDLMRNQSLDFSQSQPHPLANPRSFSSSSSSLASSSYSQQDKNPPPLPRHSLPLSKPSSSSQSLQIPPYKPPLPPSTHPAHTPQQQTTQQKYQIPTLTFPAPKTLVRSVSSNTLYIPQKPTAPPPPPPK